MGKFLYTRIYRTLILKHVLIEHYIKQNCYLRKLHCNEAFQKDLGRTIWNALNYVTKVSNNNQKVSYSLHNENV